MNGFALFLVRLMAVLAPCSVFSCPKPSSGHVVVSIAAYMPYIQELTEGEVSVQLAVPENINFHSYEPTPSQIMAISTADIWFMVGELFEIKVREVARDHFPTLHCVELHALTGDTTASTTQGPSSRESHHKDIHTWLYVENMRKEVHVIAQTLSAHYPALKERILHHATDIDTRLTTLHQEVQHELATYQGRMVLVAHAAYGHFCSGYNIVQLAIEEDGKEPSLRHIYTIQETIKNREIPILFTQRDTTQNLALS